MSDLFGGVPGPSLWKRERLTINASNSSTTRGLTLTSTKAVKYILVAWNDIEAKTKYLEVSLKNENSTVSETVYNKIGTINLSIAGTVLGSELFLTITNNESYALDFDIVYLKLG